MGRIKRSTEEVGLTRDELTVMVTHHEIMGRYLRALADLNAPGPAKLYRQMSSLHDEMQDFYLSIGERLDDRQREQRRQESMRTMIKRMSALVVLLVLLVMVSAVMGQSTPEVSPPTAVATDVVTPPVEDGPPVVVEQPGFNVSGFLMGVLAGVAGALATVFGIIGKLKDDTAALNAIEWLGKSIPESALTTLNDLGQKMRDAGEVIDLVTDGKPNEPPAVG